LFPNIDIFKDKSLIIPFIRGYFDGDGCLTNTKKYPKVSFLGTE
jgi:intein/homing endonuclease